MIFCNAEFIFMPGFQAATCNLFEKLQLPTDLPGLL
jgi:hypothetical protein